MTRRGWCFLLFFVWTSFLFAETRWLESNSLGQGLRDIPWYRTDEFEWYLSYEDAGSVHEKILWKNGVEQRSWQYRFYSQGGINREESYVDGRLEQVGIYDTAGRLSGEEDYNDGILAARWSYQYQGGVLSRSVRRDGQGIELYRDTYYRGMGGNLRRVVRDFPDGSQLVSEWGIGSYGLYFESYQDGEVFNISRFLDGRQTARERWTGVERIEEEQFLYEDGKLIGSIARDSGTGEIIEQDFNEKGLIVELRVFRPDEEEPFQTKDYLYDETDRVVRETSVEENTVLQTDYRYDAGRLIEETLYQDDEIVRQIRYPEETVDEIVYYQRGEIFLVVTYRDDARIKEDFYQNGELIRTRIFETGEDAP